MFDIPVRLWKLSCELHCHHTGQSALFLDKFVPKQLNGLGWFLEWATIGQRVFWKRFLVSPKWG